MPEAKLEIFSGSHCFSRVHLILMGQPVNASKRIMIDRVTAVVIELEHNQSCFLYVVVALLLYLVTQLHICVLHGFPVHK